MFYIKFSNTVPAKELNHIFIIIVDNLILFSIHMKNIVLYIPTNQKHTDKNWHSNVTKMAIKCLKYETK